MSDNPEALLRRAFSLGQTYFQQADSESYAQNRRSEETRQKFEALVVEACAALAQQAATPAPAEPVATLFRHALVWGQTYGGPALTDGALDAMAAKFAEQVAAPPATPAAQPDCPKGEVVVTKNQAGQIVAVTRQDEEGRILSVIAEATPAAQPAETLVNLFRQALAWGLVYGPKLPDHQWDEMRDKMAAQFASQASAAAPAAPSEGSKA